jgi:hypothetical protein
MKLALVKTVHTVFYMVQVAAIVYILAAGVTGRRGRYLPHAFALVAFESAVFIGNGRRCPLTALAKRWGDPKGYVGDTFFSERCTRHTFSVFGSLLALGTGLIALRALRRRFRS